MKKYKPKHVSKNTKGSLNKIVVVASVCSAPIILGGVLSTTAQAEADTVQSAHTIAESFGTVEAIDIPELYRSEINQRATNELIPFVTSVEFTNAETGEAYSESNPVKETDAIRLDYRFEIETVQEILAGTVFSFQLPGIVDWSDNWAGEFDVSNEHATVTAFLTDTGEYGVRYETSVYGDTITASIHLKLETDPGELIIKEPEIVIPGIDDPIPYVPVLPPLDEIQTKWPTVDPVETQPDSIAEEEPAEPETESAEDMPGADNDTPAEETEADSSAAQNTRVERVPLRYTMSLKTSDNSPISDDGKTSDNIKLPETADKHRYSTTAAVGVFMIAGALSLVRRMRTK